MSEKSLDQLIASLKSEAIEAAEKESNEILEAARSQAQKIVEEAKEKKEQILTDAENEAQATIQKGESALRQAARDLYIALRNDVLQLFNSALEKEIHAAFTPDLLKSAVVKVIENIGSDVELKLPEEFAQELSDYIHKSLQSSEPVSIIKEDSNLKELTITKTDQGWSYQISPEEIAGLLQAHLIGKWADILKNKEQV